MGVANRFHGHSALHYPPTARHGKGAISSYIEGMNLFAHSLPRIVGASLGISLAACMSASAQTGTQPVIVAPNVMDLNTFQTIQRSEQFQADQRRNRSEDRQMNMRPAERPQVPVVRPSCQFGFNGVPSTRGC